ncbi:flagellar biosynthesis protein FlhB [Helicobacter ailurogastricus]|uniref:flagellar biosynthesis protein FlhB n=1 Tax=Helicobacter ailurogastricus TaxID=1578720 RepID=UPI000CF02DD6|nr:flagellar biosynthesis protein FlhB [Helicobacter ailurogastricus]GLH58253.1 Flagellar biosynthesis protein FlhB [Helicobacter ailurogastricus]GLH59125.1 Flagellar biosynthesis protein FlhB [Helicobacter ailurogastricus]
MAEEEKTELPSAKKIEKAREEGNVAKSIEVLGFLGLLGSFGGIFALFKFWLEGFESMFRESLHWIKLDFSPHNLYVLCLQLLKDALWILLPFLFLVGFIAFLANVLQFGFLFSPKAIAPKWSKINPITGFKNLFSLKRLLDGLLITTKVFIAFILGFVLVYSFVDEIMGVAQVGYKDQLLWFRSKALEVIASLLFLFLVASLLDFMLKRRQYIESLKMTKQEVKDEYKQQEGNPEIKAKIKQLMLKNSMSKMMAAIPSANVVVTNPTHYAVALRFEENDPAPVVVAKGIDHLAIRIKGVAREHEIEIIENPKLARQLYQDVDVDEVIPKVLFEAVAIVFAQVAHIQQMRNR